MSGAVGLIYRADMKSGCLFRLFYSAAGNDAEADSTAALNFASMVIMLQSIAAVKRNVKRENLFIWGAFQLKKSCFKKMFS